MTREEHIEWLAGITQCLTYEADEAAGVLLRQLRGVDVTRIGPSDKPEVMSPKEVRDMILASVQDALDQMTKKNKPD